MPFPWSPCQASMWHALRIGCHPLEGICEQMEGYIFRNKSVCTKKPEPQLGLSFPVEFVFSPSRPSLKTWVQFHASQQVCIGYLLCASRYPSHWRRESKKTDQVLPHRAHTSSGGRGEVGRNTKGVAAAP